MGEKPQGEEKVDLHEKLQKTQQTLGFLRNLKVARPTGLEPVTF
jgi:hypothetical protein